MLSYTLWRAITFPVTYLLVAILVGTAVMQIKYINRALQRFDATQVIPVQFVLFTLSVILGSAILYRDFERTSGDDAGKFVGGCAMTFLGVWLITSGRPKRTDDDDDEERDPEPEDAINLAAGERYRDDVGADGASEETPSRRPSTTIRAASPSLDIRHPVPTDSTTPDITLTPSLSREPSTSTPTPAPDLPPTLLTNPWDQESSRPSGPTLTSTLSTPVLPSQTPTLPPHSTSTPDLTTGPPRPQTPVRQTSESAAVPATPPSTLNQRLRRIATSERVPSRNSVSGPLLASPLGSSLSAVVAELKRGRGAAPAPMFQGGTGTGSAARRGSVLGIGAGETNGEDGDAGFGGVLERGRSVGESYRQGEEGSSAGRGRSLSGTLNELWRGWRGGAVEGEAQTQTQTQTQAQAQGEER